jgi:hypothetical protein
MSAPRYRTLDGEELELPLAMGTWVVVPRGLARFDPELAWALDYDDAPEPDHADPRLDYSDGALLVPVERWNERAELEPNLGPCEPQNGTGAPLRPAASPATALGRWIGPQAAPRRPAIGLTRRAGRVVLFATLSLLAVVYVVAVAAWLWSLRSGISGPRMSTGVTLLGTAVLLAWLMGVAGAWRPGPCPPPRTRSWAELGAAITKLADDPLGILRAGLALQLVGFVLLVALR